MGYELNLKVGSAYTSMVDEKGRMWFNQECEIDLCKCGNANVAELAEKYMKKIGKPVVYWYVGDKQTDEDAYGDKPTPIPLKLVIETLQKDVVTASYRRFEWALALLKAIDKNDLGGEFCVIFEGH